MCVNPVNLFNNSNEHYLAQRLTMQVPCGKCYECLDKKAQDYQARCYYQYKYCKDNGGWSLFDTLTYSNESVPVTNVVSPETGEIVKFQHFCSEDISYFIKKLRIYLTRCGYDIKDKLKFFVSCEYGSKRHRPHYHIIFFSTVPNLDPATLARLIQKCWTFGFTDNKHYSLRVITDFRAIRYVTKYVTKKDDYLEHLLSLFGDDVPDITFQWQPFFRSSPGLGFDSLVRNMNDNFEIKMPTKQGIITQTVSRYVLRKLCNEIYYVYRDGRAFLRWMPNKVGIELKQRIIDQQINRLSLHFNSLYETLKHEKAYEVELKKIKSLLGKRTWRDLAEYSLAFQGVYLPTFMLNRLSNLDVSTVLKWQLNPSSVIELDVKQSKHLNYVNQNSTPRFCYFDVVLQLLRKLHAPFKQRQAAANRQKQLIRDKLLAYAEST